jgi:hypothetical protein
MIKKTMARALVLVGLLAGATGWAADLDRYNVDEAI